MMSEELRACPFCGSEPEYFDNEGEGWKGMCWCTNRKCSARDPMTVEEWNTRPIEDTLRAKLEVAMKALNIILIGKAGINISANYLRGFDIGVAEEAIRQIDNIGASNVE
jgi:hypothetical protein